MKTGRPGFYPNSVRALFISDVHLGSRYCQASALLQLIQRCRPQYLYLVGDLFDHWLLGGVNSEPLDRTRWRTSYTRLLAGMRHLKRHGTQINYILGNHDRESPWHRDVRYDGYEPLESCVHTTAQGHRLLVIHGDQFDSSQTRLHTAAKFAAQVHESVLGGAALANRILTEYGFQQRRFATALTVPIKTIAHSTSKFVSRAVRAAAEAQCAGVICGHTHSPKILAPRNQTDTPAYLNTGDWLEHCSAIVETTSGQIELWRGSPNQWHSNTPQRLTVLPRIELGSASLQTETST